MEQNVTFTSNGFQLSGTLRFPDSSAVIGVVLLIVGSGQIDRDENHKKIHINALKEIAVYLEKQRIATLRYDKRGVGESEGDYWRAGFYDNVADAASALKYLKTQPQFDTKPIFVLGHSEGALISIRLAAEHSELAGAILVAGSAQIGEATIRWQAQEVAKGLRGFNAFLIKLLRIDIAKSQDKALKHIKQSPKDWFRQGMIRKINAKWFRETLAYDPAMDLSKTNIPILALTGSKDIQVNPADLKRMAELVKSDFEYHEIPNLTHMLRTEESPATISTYKEQVKRPLDPGLLQIIGLWLTKHIQSK